MPHTSVFGSFTNSTPFAWRATGRARSVSASHQTIANDTGLSKSAVQAAVRHLVRRHLLRSERASITAVPEHFVLRPWRR